MCKCICVSVIFVALFSLANSQGSQATTTSVNSKNHTASNLLQEGGPCRIPNGPNSICINIYDCKVVLDIVSRNGLTIEDKNYVRSLSCGQSNGRTYVCCPQTISTRDTNTIQPELLYKEKFLLPPKCGWSNGTLLKVVGGIPAQLGNFPWMVALGYRNESNRNMPRWLCGGTLITYRHVLTAAHCIENRSDLYLARVGALDLNYDVGANPRNIQIAGAKAHENFKIPQYINDIGILTLAESVEGLAGVWPICLPFEDDKRTKSYVGSRPLVAGWGRLDFKGPSSSTLQLTSIPIVDNSQCEKVYGRQTIIDERIICAGYAQGGRDACLGDSGGPFMHGVVSREAGLNFYQIGVISYGHRCAEPGIPGAYTKVTQFLNWIGKNLN